MAGWWLNLETGLIVKVATTHDEYIRDRQNAADLGLPEAAYEEVMSYAANEIDPIRFVGLRHGLVRVREHKWHVSVQHWTEAEKVGAVLAAVARELIAVGIHADTRLVIDNLLTGDSRAITLRELRGELEMQKR